MGNCIICGTSTDGLVCDVHQEDVLFEFTGNEPSQLTPGRFYKGTVDGYAEFGVFINIGNVTGLLHRSKLDQRIESLDWDEGDEVSVQVNNVRDNGDIDLDSSIRQTADEFRGMLVQTPDGEHLPDAADDDEADADEQTGGSPESSDDGPTTQEPSVDEQTGGNPSDPELAEMATESDEDDEAAAEAEEAEAGDVDAESDIDRVAVETLRDRVGDVVRLEGVVASVRQTSGPTVFELRDETGIVDCAAFVEAGVRAYPEIETDDVVRLDGEVRLRRDEIQVETDSLVALEDDAREDVESRMDAAIENRARPESVEPLADDDAVSAITDDIADAATEIRRAVLESRPVVVRHDATTDGYVAGAAIERAVLPLIRDEYESADAVYHYFDRRPLEDGVYDMDDATKDVTRMLDDRERHDEKLPLFVFAAAGSTAASTDGLELLDVYDAPRVVLDGRPVDDAVDDEIDAPVTADGRTSATVAAAVAAAVNGDVRADLEHLPAVSYWDETPTVYTDLATGAGFDEETVEQLREAIALEAFYQSYEDKRQLIIDLLFGEQTGLAAQVSEQFDTKLEAELETATTNLDERTVDGYDVTVLDTDAYTHTYDFPPTRLLLDELSRRLDADAVVGVATDELHLRAADDIDISAVADTVAEAVPNAGVSDPGAREPKLEFLAGKRDAVIDAVVDAVAEQVTAPSA
ncbi:DHH/RecJ family phosphoesterase [Natronomonas pharaonis DSM 2160]|uniref:DHH/RecJ family phosphoesterase n=1 Tax=Natronomonas pharaonis (strain ATCC 35678 / DSM 2160 / CIP 103997 / JCM 8858 / NBRC 14720 / NCIMB 2260 / Gabara) TaxID=348780 RepID=A0A1U7EWP1_NATPD|nr:OB-fold nucleic acid binding domain-containing protein [Natronomonas pharaonis]CAI49528.1 DHH/RecJ family phosphoesterase [Natronomonas pharaonis DSM 2160]